MKLFSKSPLVLLSFICSILFFTACSKDSDLLLDAVLLDDEIGTIENSGSDGTDGSGEEEGSEPTGSSTNRGVVNLLSNGTFANDDEWSLLNGSTATGGVLTVVANGNIAADFPNWSAQYADILPQTTYEVRRYRLTFTARRTVGSGELQIGQRFSIIPHESLTGTFASYVIEFNGEGGSGGNDLVFGGATPGDTFEFTDMVLEDIGASTEDGAGGTGSSAQIAFYTDFDTDQWGDNGVPEPQGNYWEVDHGLPRTTDHPDSPLKAGRNGTGRALWLGSYNGDSSRNEVGKDNALSFAEHWMGVSIYVQNKLDKTRLMIQNRLIANGSSNTVNAISLRQGDPGKLYFSLPTDVNSVDTLPTNGAGSNTESVLFDYNEGEWIDIVLHYKGAFGADYQGADTSELARSLGFDPRNDGFIEIWVNGEKLVDHVGTTAYRYAKQGQEISGIITPKIGPYWSDALSPNGDVYYDNYRLWVGPDGTYQDIDPSK